MSYCRWSSDNYPCDVYAYETEWGFQVHVADKRYVGDIPSLPDILKVSNSEFFEAYKRQMEAIDKAESRKIGGEYDGKSFGYDTLEELLEGLLDIRSKGYLVPDWVFGVIRDEISV